MGNLGLHIHILWKEKKDKKSTEQNRYKRCWGHKAIKLHSWNFRPLPSFTSSPRISVSPTRPAARTLLCLYRYCICGNVYNYRFGLHFRKATFHSIFSLFSLLSSSYCPLPTVTPMPPRITREQAPICLHITDKHVGSVA